MRDFIQESLNEAYKQGGRTYQFISGCARRAENFLGSDWYIYLDNGIEMRRATEVNVYFMLYAIDDLKLSKYQTQEDKIISEINSLLKNEGIKDWIITKSGFGNFFATRRMVSFVASRPESNFIDFGASSLKETVQIVGQLLTMKGFFITDVLIRKQGILIFQAWHSPPSSTEIYELETLMTFSEREDAIDGIVEKKTEELAKPKLSFIEKIELTAKRIVIIAIIILVVYLLIVYQKPIKAGIEAIGEKVGKSNKKD